MNALRPVVLFALTCLAAAQQPFDELLPILRRQGAAEQLRDMQRFAARDDAAGAIAPLLAAIRAEAPALDNDGCLALEQILRAHPDAGCELAPLLEVLARPIWNSRQKAAQALEVLLQRDDVVGDNREELARAVIPLLTSQRSRVFGAGARCLARIAGRDLGDDPVAAREWFFATFHRGIDLHAAVHERVVVLTFADEAKRGYVLGGEHLADAAALHEPLRAERDAAAAQRMSLGVVLQVPEAVVMQLLDGGGADRIAAVLDATGRLGIDGLTVAPESDVFRAPFVQPAAPAALQQRLDACLAGLAKDVVPGAQAAVVLPDGTLVTCNFGVADRDAKTPMHSGGRMLAGSTGKTFYGALALQLVAEGRLSLDDPLSKHLGAEAWFARLPNAKDVTLRQLMMHRSGIMRYEFAPEFVATLTERPDHLFSPEEEVQFVLDKEPRFAAGEGFDYSDTNFVLLGMVIERVTGEPCRAQIERRFLQPLRLADTVPSVGRRVPGLLQGFAGKGNPFGGRDAMLLDGELPFDPGFEGAGGGYASSARDLARWAVALYADRDAHRERGSLVLGALRDQALAGEPAPLGRGARYGLGVMIDRTAIGPAVGHSGFFPGWLSAMRYYPERRVAVAVLVNSSADPRLGHTLTAWATALAEVATVD